MESEMREAYSFCRLCEGNCGTKLSIDSSGRIVEIRGDRAHPLTAGYACSKGIDAALMHNRGDRLLHPLKKMPDGQFVKIGLEDALDEIAAALGGIIGNDGPEAVAAFLGTNGYLTATASMMLPAFMRAIGSPSFFSSLTIDQSAKVVAVGRMGAWGGGKQPWADADVWMVFGGNPLVSISGSVGMPRFNPTKTIKTAKARGLKLIVVDPRRTETATYADIFLQPRPGFDAEIAAAMIRTILDEGLEDEAFCAAYVGDMVELRAAIEPFTPQMVAERAGINAADLVAAARMFAEGPRGCTGNATGPNMGPHSNLAVHMIETLNVICGRFLRMGEALPNPGVTMARISRRAEVIPPPRWWEQGPRTRSRNFGSLDGGNGGELPTPALAEEILMPGKGQIKALFNDGGNPALSIPDQAKVVKAFQSLELLVSIDPLMSATAMLSHYIIPPRLMYERADLPMQYGQPARTPVPYWQYTPAIVEPPAGADVADDWYVFWSLAKRLGRQISFAGVQLDMETPPGTDDLLALSCRHGEVTLDMLRDHPHGYIFDVPPQFVEPARPDATARFALMPADVAVEMTDVLAREPSSRFPLLMSSRRMRDVHNSLRVAPELGARRSQYNPVHIHPDDLLALGIEEGADVEVISDNGSIVAIVESDSTMRPGVVSMTHCWGGLPGEPGDYRNGGSNVSLLISGGRDCENINGMPRMSAIPVKIVATTPSSHEVLTRP